MTLRTLNYGNYGIFLIMGHAGFWPSTVSFRRSTYFGLGDSAPKIKMLGSEGLNMVEDHKCYAKNISFN